MLSSGVATESRYNHPGVENGCDPNRYNCTGELLSDGEIPEPYNGGTIPVTLPFTNNGLESGNYNIIVLSYKKEINEFGEEEYVYAPSPINTFKVNYTQPQAPDVPNTGRFLGNSSVVKSEYAISIVIAFVGIAAIALAFITRKKKEYRKNHRSRK